MHTGPCYSVAHSTPGPFLVKVQWIFPCHFTLCGPIALNTSHIVSARVSSYSSWTWRLSETQTPQMPLSLGWSFAGLRLPHPCTPGAHGTHDTHGGSGNTLRAELDRVMFLIHVQGRQRLHACLSSGEK